MKLTFLGTGTSFGIPVVGCDCRTCTSEDSRDRRTRHAALLETEVGRLLVDTPPELRLQLLRAGVDRVDSVWFTHTHADHVAGMDDVRIFSARQGHPLPAHAAEAHREELLTRFAYIFDPRIPAPEGTTKPRLDLVPFRAGEAVRAVGRDLIPLEVPHGHTRVYGFRCGPLGYVTDAKRLPEDTLRALRGVRVLVLNALWFGHPHPTHFNVEEAVQAARDVGSERTWLTHLTHRLRHRDLLERLPDDVRPAWDGLTLDIDEEI